MDKEIRKVEDIRDDISKIDYQIAELFEKRMGFAAELALSKKASGESIYNKNKEDEKMSDITKNRSNPFVVKGLEEIFIQMMSISRKYQYHMVHQRDRYIENYFTEVPELVMFPDTRVDIQVFQALFQRWHVKSFSEQMLTIMQLLILKMLQWL